MAAHTLKRKPFFVQHRHSPLVLAAFLMILLVPGLRPAAAQTPEGVRIEIRLRAADGVPLGGEPVTLQRLPDEEPMLPACNTDAQGTCAWRVDRGLYQALFARPLDGVTALALAEGGLRGFGLTVGEADVAYHFTLHGDGHIYFDAAPEAAVPAPIIPAPDPLHGGVAPLPTPKPTAAPETAAQPPIESGAPPAGSAVIGPAPAGRRWPLALLAGLGLALGSALHFLGHQRSGEAWSGRRRRQQKAGAGRAQRGLLRDETARAGSHEEERDA